LYGGRRVPKDNLRVETYGTIDELNSVLGVAATQVMDQEVLSIISRLQNELLAVGADIAAPLEGTGETTRVRPDQVELLEAEIDRFTGEMAPLKNFILPGGSPGAAYLHLARSVCRRAERHLVTLLREETLNPLLLQYLNRLSDHLFVAARLVNHRAGITDIIWKRPDKS
jgi:cob(I)alamin adenosyltransferase